MKQLRTSIFLLFVWLIPFMATAQVPDPPSPPRLVNDLANILSAGEEQTLENKLVEFDKETSTQITVVTVKSLEGYDAGDFAFRIAEKWGVGQKGKNNGVLILVKPKIGNESGQVYIAVGYGLEAVIPDAVANRKIIQDEMIPRFKEDDYHGGINNGVDVIMSLARGEYTAEEYAGNGKAAGGMIIFLLIVVIFIIFFAKNGKHFDSGRNSGIPPVILGGSSNNRGSWGSFSSGSGGFGGGSFGGGGFGGFGGGSFGGGGAGGSW
ncbi:MAG: TPM domain-containing protein [Prolixibacteraceae bacterium]|nr:TPM domain-containing protein [Prolixibacteraceae bacterium]